MDLTIFESKCQFRVCIYDEWFISGYSWHLWLKGRLSYSRATYLQFCRLNVAILALLLLVACLMYTHNRKCYGRSGLLILDRAHLLWRFCVCRPSESACVRLLILYY